jgi:hypothetical protein
MSEQWYHTASGILPPNKEVVRTMDSGGYVQELYRDNERWFVPDGSTYVYYTPTMWTSKE